MASSDRPLSPHLQVYRWQITSVLSISHRLTGLLLAAASVLLVAWLVALASGPAAYERALGFFAHGAVRALLVLVSLAFFFHLCNGIRHLLWDLGWGFEIPQVHASGWTTVALSALLTAGFWLWVAA